MKEFTFLDSYTGQFYTTEATDLDGAYARVCDVLGTGYVLENLIECR